MSFLSVVEKIASWLWGPQTVVMLLGVGIYLTVRLRFIQIRKLPFACRLLSKNTELGETADERSGDISPLSALCVSLATVIGNGNIAGVCTAIELGGPGAIFWMWISALFGMATKMVEAVLGQRFKVVASDGTIAGGPMYYISRGLGWGWLGGLFALFMGCKALFSTSIVQGNSIAVAMNSELNISPQVTGVLLAVFTWLVIIGGLQSIARVTQFLAPLMVVFYFGGAIITLAQFADQIPHALRLIVVGAFNPQAVGGGIAGATLATAMRYGLARGAYSNEAGTGTAGVFHAPAKTSEPVRQGMLASIDVFLDTFVVCSLTALVVIATGVWDEGTTSTAMAASGFSQGMPVVGGLIVSLSSLLFGFSSLIGTPYYGETALAYLFGVKVKKIFRWLYCGFVLVGALLTVRIAWSLSDVLNGLMTITNLVGLILLSGLAVQSIRSYASRIDQEPT